MAMAMRTMPGLERRLKSGLKGDVMFDAFSRGRYATDASIYQMMPLGIAVPETVDDIRAALSIAREEGVPVLPRGGGTSQAGQTVNGVVLRLKTSAILSGRVTDARGGDDWLREGHLVAAGEALHGPLLQLVEAG